MYSDIIWKALCLALKSVNLPDSQWELALPGALHSITSLLTTSTDSTPHERFQRRSSHGTSMPSWPMSPSPVLLRRFIRANKNDLLVDQVDLQEANLTYAHVCYLDGRKYTVSFRDLAPCQPSRCWQCSAFTNMTRGYFPD